MALDQPPSTFNDNIQALTGPASAVPSESLTRLQKDAGVFGPSASGDNGKLTDGANQIVMGSGLDKPFVEDKPGAAGKGDHGIDLSGIEKLLREQPPSDKERADAEKTLEGRMSKLIPEADRQAMKDMTTALMNGDSKAFAEAVKKAGGDPEKLKNLVAEVNKGLEEKGSNTRLDVTADGKVLVSDRSHDTAVSFDPKTGNIESKSVEHNFDGSILIKPGELVNSDSDKTFKEIGDDTVNAVNGKNHHFSFDPFSPEFPETPWHRKPIEHPWGTVTEEPWIPKTYKRDPFIIWD